jgi:L-malate glycosyltransferase
MERFVLRIAEAQSRDGHAVSVMAFQGGPLEAEARARGLSVVVLGGVHKAFRAARGAVEFMRLRPNIINAHNQTSLHYAVLGKRVSGAKVVLTNHGQGMGSSRTPGRAEWRQTDSVVTVSEAVARHIAEDEAVPKERITTIYNGVEFQPARRQRAQVRTELGIPEDQVVGIIVARMDDRKGHETLLRAMAILHRETASVTPLTVLMAGDGEQRAKFERLAQEGGLRPDDVRFLGFRDDVPDLLAASDLFLLPSLTEGLPLSLLEAMSHGLPSIATPVGGIPELLTPGRHGILVPAKDTAALADALRSLSGDANLRRSYGQAALQRVRSDFSFSRMTAEYEILYHRLCGSESEARV